MPVIRVECASTLASMDAARRAHSFPLHLTWVGLLGVVGMATMVFAARTGLVQSLAVGLFCLGLALTMGWAQRGTLASLRSTPQPSGHAELDEDSITVCHEGRRTTIPWPCVTRVVRTRHEHLVFPTDGRVVAVALGNPEADALMARRTPAPPTPVSRKLLWLAIAYVASTAVLPTVLTRLSIDAHVRPLDRIVCGRD